MKAVSFVCESWICLSWLNMNETECLRKENNFSFDIVEVCESWICLSWLNMNDTESWICLSQTLCLLKRHRHKRHVQRHRHKRHSKDIFSLCVTKDILIACECLCPLKRHRHKRHIQRHRHKRHIHDSVSVKDIFMTLKRYILIVCDKRHSHCVWVSWVFSEDMECLFHLFSRDIPCVCISLLAHNDLTHMNYSLVTRHDMEKTRWHSMSVS